MVPFAMLLSNFLTCSQFKFVLDTLRVIKSTNCTAYVAKPVSVVCNVCLCGDLTIVNYNSQFVTVPESLEGDTRW